jgi:plastocyanin domain-containing protein
MLLINLVGVGLISLIVWWFWLYKPNVVNALEDNITIRVENGIYSPNIISIEKNKASKLTFIRVDNKTCSETVLIPSLDIVGELPINTPVAILLPPMKEGEYAFHCSMNMYQGKIISK